MRRLLGPGGFGLPLFFAMADADEFGFFLFFSLLEQRGETFGAEAKLLLHAGVRIVWIMEFLEQQKDVEFGTGEFDFGVIIHDELGI